VRPPLVHEENPVPADLPFAKPRQAVMDKGDVIVIDLKDHLVDEDTVVGEYEDAP
jgi:hypothetical protein